LAALKAHRFRLEPTAAALRITRPSLYMLIDKSTRLRKAKDVPKEEILELHQQLGGDVDAMAERLEVSSRGLYLRLKEILSRGT
jgi:two-component system, NtrC family, nitrogen regulation response regulator GlnG